MLTPHAMTTDRTEFIEIERSVRAIVRPSERVLRLAAMFGLGVDEQQSLTIVPPMRVPLRPGSVIFITGPSGGGKSTILSLIADAAKERSMRTLITSELPELADVPIVDAIDLPLPHVTSLLARIGLGDAFVMLRRPAELSDGQRSRLRLAQLLFHAEQQPDTAVILADEFGATLDRLTAAVIARNLRAWVARSRHVFVCATTHDDLLEALAPDVLIYKPLGSEAHLIERQGDSSPMTGRSMHQNANPPIRHVEHV